MQVGLLPFPSANDFCLVPTRVQGSDRFCSWLPLAADHHPPLLGAQSVAVFSRDPCPVLRPWHVSSAAAALLSKTQWELERAGDRAGTAALARGARGFRTVRASRPLRIHYSVVFSPAFMDVLPKGGAVRVSFLSLGELVTLRNSLHLVGLACVKYRDLRSLIGSENRLRGLTSLFFFKS